MKKGKMLINRQYKLKEAIVCHECIIGCESYFIKTCQLAERQEMMMAWPNQCASL